MKKGKFKRISVMVVVVVSMGLTLFMAYEYNELLRGITVDDFAGTYHFERSDQYVSIMQEEDEKTFSIYDSYSKCIATGTYQKVEENCVSFSVDGQPFATLLYSNGKFCYVEEGQEVVVLDKITDSPLTTSE